MCYQLRMNKKLYIVLIRFLLSLNEHSSKLSLDLLVIRNISELHVKASSKAEDDD